MTETPDPFLDPLSALTEMSEKDDSNLPEDMPDELKEIINNIRNGGGDNVEMKSMVLSMGPNGPEFFDDDGNPAEVPDFIRKVFESDQAPDFIRKKLMGEDDNDGEEDDEGYVPGEFNRTLEFFKSGFVDDSATTADLFQQLGFSEEEALSIGDDSQRLCEAFIDGSFRKEAAKMLRQDTPIEAGMTMNTQMAFAIGYYMNGVRHGEFEPVATNTDGSGQPEQGGDPGGTGESD